MNKETLGQYGWVVVCVMVLAIMITFATPFGNKIAGGVVKTVTNITSSANTALDEISVGGYDGGVEDPDGSAGVFAEDPDPTHETPNYGDTIVEGDYTYEYMESVEILCFEDGWVVRGVTDTSKEEYGPICETIYGQPVKGMFGTFVNCENITSFPDIPKSVRTLNNIFPYVDTVKETIVIPETVPLVHITTDIAPIKVPAATYALFTPEEREEYFPKGIEMSNKKTYSWNGKSFKPEHAAPQNGEQIVIGDFVYCYNYALSGATWFPYYECEDGNLTGGWCAMSLTPFEPTNSDKICTDIYGKPVTTIFGWYRSVNVGGTITVPETVTALVSSFYGTTADVVNIPASVTYLSDCFGDSNIGVINFEAEDAPEGFVEPSGVEVNYGVEM